MNFWAQVETVEVTGRGSYPDGFEMLLLCTEHHWTEQEYFAQSDFHIQEMLEFRGKKIIGQNHRAKKAARKAKGK